MAGNSLTTAAVMMCPHGGAVQVISANTRAKAGGVPLALATDTYLVAGCAFTLPGPVPSPCITVRWLVPDMRCKVSSSQTLSLSSVGLCYSAQQAPQGPVVIVNTQAKVSTM